MSTTLNSAPGRAGSSGDQSMRGTKGSRPRSGPVTSGVLAEAITLLLRAAFVTRRTVISIGRRLTEVVTWLGWTMFALAGFGLIGGYRYGWIELVALGYAAVGAILAAGVYLLGRTSFDITLRLQSHRVTVGDSAPVQVTVQNPGRRRLLGARIEIPIGTGRYVFTLPSLMAGQEHLERFAVPTARRGVIPVGPVHSVRADPIGLLRREVIWTEQTRLYVHPRTVVIPRTGSGLIRDLEGGPTADLTNSDLSFHAIREYLPGDDRRHMHWKSTAKTGSYMVRQFEQTRRSHLILALSLAQADYAGDEDFEIAVSAAASLSVRAIQDGQSLSAVVSAPTPESARRAVFDMRTLSTVSRSRLLDDLAGVERDPTALGLGALAKVAATRIGSVSTALLICGPTVSPRELRAAAAAFPLGVEVVAVACDAGARPGLRRASGFSVLTIGYLEDLQKSLTRIRA